MNSLSYGMPGDVDNRIPFSAAYPGARASAYTPLSADRMPYRNNSSGQLGTLAANRIQSTRPSNADAQTVASAPNAPANSWLLFGFIFVAFIWLSRRYSGGIGEGSIKMTVYNGIFLTFFIVLILNFLKVGAAKVRIPGVSELILAA